LVVNILIAAHKHPIKFEPRGGEHSMRIIAEHCAKTFGHCKVLVRDPKKDDTTKKKVHYLSGAWGDLYNDIKAADVVLTWGKAAPSTASLCIKLGKPYIVFVRWWRNVHSLPPGNLMSCPKDERHIAEHKHIFENARAVITNNHYAAKVIMRFYDCCPVVSYVPILGTAKKLSSSTGRLLCVTPNKGLGEARLLTGLAKLGHEILIVNAPPEMNNDYWKQFKNVEVRGYVEDMETVWKGTSILLLPLYVNDICGTTRVAIEAQRHGVPVIANNRSGVDEKVDNVVDRDATVDEWHRKIKFVKHYYYEMAEVAMRNFRKYNTKEQLKIITDQIVKAYDSQ